jgi:ribosome assembly protein 1
MGSPGTLSLNLLRHTHKNREPKTVLQSVVSRWLPLSDVVMDMAVECTPDPVAAQGVRVARLPERELKKR